MKNSGFSFEVHDIARRASVNADCIGAGRLGYIKDALIDNGFHGIANSKKRLDALAFSVDFLKSQENTG